MHRRRRGILGWRGDSRTASTQLMICVRAAIAATLRSGLWREPGRSCGRGVSGFRFSAPPLVRDNRTGSSLPFPDKCFALIAYLALDGEKPVARRDAVAAFLWEDSDSDKAAVNLRSLLRRIREIQKAIGLDLIHADREHVGLARAEVDAGRLRELARDRSEPAVLEQSALYQGSFPHRSCR